MRFVKFSIFLAFLAASFSALAQVSYVPITGTVVDPNGHPFANAAISATLVDKYGNPVTSAKTPNGSLYNGAAGPGSVSLDASGFFSLGLVPNGILSNPSGTQWRINIDNPADRAILSYEPSWRITYTLTVTTTQDISSQLNALAKPIAFFNLITNQSTIQGGLITAISAGAGLNGGGSSGNVTLGCSIATTGAIGCVKPDGTTISIDVDGTIHAIGGGSSTVKVNGTTVANANFNNSTPAPASGWTNIQFQQDGSGNISGQVNLSSGPGVQYNPSTTAYLVTSVSSIYDDGNSSASIDLGVPVSVTCTGTGPSTCTVVTAAAHGLSVGGAIDMHNLSGWPVAPGGVVQQSAQYGSFQITTVPNLTTITFTTPTNLSAYTCSPCTGHVWDASLWAIWQFAKQPFIYGHGTVFGLETDTNSLNVNWTTLTAPFLASGSTPMYLIDVSGVNDFFVGRTVSQVESDHLSVYAKAHTAAMKVVQTTLPPAQSGSYHLTTQLGQFNLWAWILSQGITSTQIANGQYIDRYVDAATALMGIYGAAKMPTPSANLAWGQAVNDQAFSTQAGSPIAPPSTFSYGNGSSADNPSHSVGITEYYFDGNWNLFRSVGVPAGAFTTDSWSAPGNSPIKSYSWPNASNGVHICTPYNLYSGTGNDHFSMCMGADFTASANNYLSFAGPSDSDIFKLFADYHIQTPHLVASSGTQPVVVDTAGNWSVGSAGGSCGTGNIPCTNTSNVFNGGTQTIQSNTYNVTPLIAKGNVSGIIAPTVVQAGTAGGGTITLTSVSAGDTIVVLCQGGQDGSDSSLDTFHHILTAVGNGYVSYAYNVAGGSNVTVGCSGSPFAVYQLTNVASGATLDVSSSTNYSSTLTATNSITTTVANDLLIIGTSNAGPGSFTVGAPWTNPMTSSGAYVMTARQVATTIGAYSGTFTFPSNGTGTLFTLAFKGASGLSQSADLQQFQNPSGTVLSAVDANGVFRGPNGSNEVVTFSATPTFSTAYRSSQITMTSNITSFTLGSGIDGQEKTLCFIQDATGSRTVAAPANVHGFFTVGSTASKASCQHFTYVSSLSAWYADSAGVTNQ